MGGGMSGTGDVEFDEGVLSGPRRWAEPAGGLGPPTGPRWRLDRGDAAPHLHRAPAGGVLRRPGGRGPDLGEPRLRRLLPERPLSGHGDTTASPAPATPGSPWPGWPGRPAGSGSGPCSPRRPSDSRSTGHHGGRGRCHERWPGGAGPRGRVVRRRAHRLRHPVPAAGRAVRAPGGAAGRHHRPVGDAGRRARSPSPGRHYRLPDSPALPKPVQRPRAARSSSGGGGATRTPRLAAMFAAEFNMPFSSLADTAASSTGCGRPAGRPDATPTRWCFSAAQTVCCGRNEAEIDRRAGAIGRDVDELRANGLCGTPEEVVAKLARFAEAAPPGLPAGPRPARPGPPGPASPRRCCPTAPRCETRWPTGTGEGYRPEWRCSGGRSSARRPGQRSATRVRDWDPCLQRVGPGGQHDLVGVGAALQRRPGPGARRRGPRSGGWRWRRRPRPAPGRDTGRPPPLPGWARGPSRPVRSCRMLSAEGPASQRASSSVGAQSDRDGHHGVGPVEQERGAERAPVRLEGLVQRPGRSGRRTRTAARAARPAGR